MKNIALPLRKEDTACLRAGESLNLTGKILTGRDAAHKRLCALIDEGKPLPVSLEGACIYYVGPCPAPQGRIIGSCGPTTSGRMDACAPRLIERGLRGMIGKGPRDEAVVHAMRVHGAVYFSAVGGAGALYASRVTACRVVAFEDLGTEAIYELTVKDFPVITAIDARGGNLYASGPEAWKRNI